MHYKIGKEVRSAIERIGGTMPEDLPNSGKIHTAVAKRANKDNKRQKEKE